MPKLGTASSKRLKEKTKSKKRETNSQLKRKADDIFSLYIRERDKFTCYTCGKVGERNNTDCGHYISRTFLGTRYDETNCHAQCKSCNIFKHGNLAFFATRLELDYGHGILQELEKKAKDGQLQPSRALFIEVICYYSKKLEDLLKLRNAKIIIIYSSEQQFEKLAQGVEA